MNKEDMKVLYDDREALNWIDKFSGNDLLKKSWEHLKKYYDECKDKLKESSNLKFNTNGDGSRSKLTKFVKSKLGFNMKGEESPNTKDPEFIKDFCEFIGMSEDKIISIINSNEDSQERDDLIIKMLRFYNLRLKYIHSIRVTYIAKYELDNLIGEENYDNYKLVTNAVLLSALYHDIGRFYQAINYNSLNDDFLHSEEGLERVKEDERDHAVAGYFLSIVNAIGLHVSLEKNDFEHIAMFIQETMAAIAVRFHQESNVDNPHFDNNGDIKQLSDLAEDKNGEKYIKSLLDFIKDSYKIAEAFGLVVDFEEKHKKFIKEFVKKLFNDSKIKGSFSAGFESDESVKEIMDGVQKIVTSEITNSKNKTADKIAETIFKKISKFLSHYMKIELDDVDKFNIKNSIIELLNKMLNFDIAQSVDTLMRADLRDDCKFEINEFVKLFISRCLTITTDADKLDIFNQRASGKYNIGYTMESYEIFPERNQSLIQLLKEYFNIELSTDPIIIDKDILKVLNGLRHPVIKGLKDNLFTGLDLFEIVGKDTEGKDIWKFRKDIKRIVISNKTDVKVEFSNEETKDYQTDSFYTLFTEDYLKLINKKCLLQSNNLSNFKEFKRKNLADLQISVPTSMLEKQFENIEDEDKKLQARVTFYKKIVMSDGIINRLRYAEHNEKKKWVCEATDKGSDHIVQCSITALLWQINQFIFVNMRNLYSFKLVEETDMLGTILNQYKDKGADLEYELLKEHIEYAKNFVKAVINYCKIHNLDCVTAKDLERIRSNPELYLDTSKKDEKKKSSKTVI